MRLGGAMSDAVQTFRAISWLIFKWLLITIAVLISLAAAGIGFYFAQQWYTHDRHAAAVQLYISFDQNFCASQEYPIGVLVMNKSSRTITRTTFTLEAFVPGRSTNIAQSEFYSDDHIIKPGANHTYCWRVPPLREKVMDFRKLDWVFGYQSFKFAD